MFLFIILRYIPFGSSSKEDIKMTKNKTTNKLSSTQWIAGVAIFTAIVFVLQFFGRYIHFGVFSISLVLVPIVTGAILFGAVAGAWLGAAFGIAVLLSGDAAVFIAVNPIGTILTCVLKGHLAGLTAWGVYSLIKKKNTTIATFAAAFIAPIVNTGVFLIGCRLFFMSLLREWAGGTDVLTYMLTSFVGINFLIELAVNIVLSPIIVRLVSIGKKTFK